MRRLLPNPAGSPHLTDADHAKVHKILPKAYPLSGGGNTGSRSVLLARLVNALSIMYPKIVIQHFLILNKR